MDDDFINLHRSGVFSYMIFLLENSEQKQKFITLYNKLFEYEEIIQKYIYQIEEFSGIDFDDDDGSMINEKLDGDEYYCELVEKFEQIAGEIGAIRTHNDNEYIAKNIMLAEASIYYDMTNLIDVYASMLESVYLNFDRRIIARRLFDVRFIYFEQFADVMSKNPDIKSELLGLVTLLEISKNCDISDVYFYMAMGAVYDMLGDINNIILYLESAKKILYMSLKNMLHNLSFIYSEIRKDKARSEMLIREIKKYSSYVKDEFIDCAIERADEYYFYTPHISSSEMKKILQEDYYNPLKIYLYLNKGGEYFRKKNYFDAERYYLLVLDHIKYYFEFIYYKLGDISESKKDYEEALNNYIWIYNSNEIDMIKNAFSEGKNWHDLF